MQISHVCIHAIIKERHFFPKKRNVLYLGIGYWVLDIGYWILGIGYRVLN